MSGQAAQFRPSPSRLDGELEVRKSYGRRRLGYYNSFLDDYLRGILPHDLVCLGAPTGVGKTELAFSIASLNAKLGRPTYYFALEAEERELEWRKKFAILAQLVYGDREHPHPRRHELNFDDWMLGDQEGICERYNDQAEQILRRDLATLYTLYRESKFDPDDLARSLIEIRDRAQLILLDHLHYVDNDDDDEHRALGEIVKLVRDISLRIGKPIILVAHLRKKDGRSKKIFVDEHDFHGSSNVVKICTQVISLQPALDLKPKHWALAPTYVQILKHRRSGRCPYVAVMNFDRRSRLYQPTYSLGRNTNGSTKWDPLKPGEEPFWASRNGHHRAWDAATAEPKPQASLPMPPADDAPHAATTGA